MRRAGDLRPNVILATIAVIGAAGLGLRLLPQEQVDVAVYANSAGDLVSANTFPQQFQEAVEALQAKRFAQAEQGFNEVLKQSPRLPEAHVNMGFTQLGLDQPRSAVDYFSSAIDLRPSQVNAYYGLGVALERSGDLRGALGAMRSYVHLTRTDDPYLPKARAALWEWETQIAQADKDEKVSQ